MLQDIVIIRNRTRECIFTNQSLIYSHFFKLQREERLRRGIAQNIIYFLLFLCVYFVRDLSNLRNEAFRLNFLQ